VRRSMMTFSCHRVCRNDVLSTCCCWPASDVTSVNVNDVVHLGLCLDVDGRRRVVDTVCRCALVNDNEARMAVLSLAVAAPPGTAAMVGVHNHDTATTTIIHVSRCESYSQQPALSALHDIAMMISMRCHRDVVWRVETRHLQLSSTHARICTRTQREGSSIPTAQRRVVALVVIAAHAHENYKPTTLTLFGTPSVWSGALAVVTDNTSCTNIIAS
jgi:hypothetical protein